MAAKFQEKGDNRFGYMSETKFVDANELMSLFLFLYIHIFSIYIDVM